MSTRPAARGWRIWLPIALSFLVYLTPLVGPHAIVVLGEWLLGGVRGGGGRSAAWFATELAVALGAQALVAAVLIWALRGRWLRLLAPALMAPFLAAALMYLFVAAIPAHFLVEPETVPETAALRERCVVPGAALMQVRTPASLPAQRFGEWWAQRPTARYALVRVPGCELVDPPLPLPTLRPGGGVDFSLDPVYIVRGGATLFRRYETAAAQQSWWLLSGDGRRFDRLAIPANAELSPVLSDQADAVAWMERIPAPDAPPFYRVHLRPLSSESDTVVDLNRLEPAAYTLAEYDAAAGEIALWHDDRLITVDRAGAIVRQSAATPSIRPQVQTYQRSGDGWLAWDAYREDGAYWLAWSTAQGAGRTRVPLGRSITSAALDPSGAFVAVSTTTSVSVGSARDAVYVLRARDGSEMFRRYLPRYTRSTVAFFDGGSFAYSDAAGTHVLQLPPA